jgi:hypothetical protein
MNTADQLKFLGGLIAPLSDKPTIRNRKAELVYHKKLFFVVILIVLVVSVFVYLGFDVYNGDGSDSGDGSGGGSGGGGRDGFIWGEKHFCEASSRGVDFCIELYDPVCGWNEDDEIIGTSSNSCFVCQDENVLYWTAGECPEV